MLLLYGHAHMLAVVLNFVKVSLFYQLEMTNLNLVSWPSGLMGKGYCSGNT